MFKYLIGFVLISSMAFAQVNDRTFEQVDSLQQSNPKHHIVFIYTDWCKYCHSFKGNTLKKENVADLVNESFYFTSLNAENESDITFTNRTFHYEPNGNRTGTHQLAKALGLIDGELTYPTTVILNPKDEIIFQYNELMSADEFLAVLTAILEG